MVCCLTAVLLAVAGPVAGAVRTECMQPDATPLSQCVAGPGGDVTIGGDGACTTVYVDRSFTEATDSALGTITIEPGGTLVVADETVSEASHLELETAGILVRGSLEVGHAGCPIGTTTPSGRTTVTFTGARPCPSPQECTGRQKGIEVAEGGSLRLFGAKGVPPDGVSWTHLRRPAGPDRYSAHNDVKAPVPNRGDTTLWLARDVSAGSNPWERGDWIAVATTSFSPFEIEVVQIAGVAKHADGGARVTLEQPLRYYHFGGEDPGPPSPANYLAGPELNYGVDERAEVALLSRNVKLTSSFPAGDENSRHWGGEIRFLQGFAEASIQGVELEKFGKAQLGSYPIHFHMDGDVRFEPLVDANSVHHSFNKCVTVHETRNLNVTNNVCARIVGHMFYQEIGTESGLHFEDNLGLGAMSNNFDVNAATDVERQALIDEHWWAGDHLTNDASSASFIHYDGLRVPNTDNPANPTHGACWKLNDGGGLNFAGAIKNGQPCKPDEYYTEPATGFWIIHPGTELIGNSIAGCQGVGRGYWYVPPLGPAAFKDLKFEPIGEFRNNRVHGCYAGVYNESEFALASDQNFPSKLFADSHGKITQQRPIIGTFDGITATRNRNRGVWLRPVWFTVRNARLATNRDSMTLVSSGGLDGNSPGVWSLIEGSVIVGMSENNVDRFGPCPGKTGAFFGCIDRTAAPAGRVRGGDEIGLGYPQPHWNFAGVMIYDGPVRIFDDRFVNFFVDLDPHLTRMDQAVLREYIYPDSLGGRDGVYEGDAALGWFQSNQSSYPTATASRGLLFENVDLRHQIYTEIVNLGPFGDGDKNTAILDLDGTLTGYRVVDGNGDPVLDTFPISLNNLMFNAGFDSVDECLAEGAQDARFEGRPTSLISPGSMATLEFSALFPKPGPDGVAKHWQDMTFTKSSTEFGKHPTMTLRSRNARGVWEPKVTSGYGYTVAASRSTSPEVAGKDLGSGIPSLITIGVVDAVKADVGPTNPFHVRMGVCYTGADGRSHPEGKAPFTITRGYKSYGGGNVDPSDPMLQQYWNKLENRYDHQVCVDLDDSNRCNLCPQTGCKDREVPGCMISGAKGCPASGVTAVPAGGCPEGTSAQQDQQGNPACIYPPQELHPAASIDELVRADGTPEIEKYFYDEKRGLLFLNVVQDIANPVGPSPLGSCTGVGDEDPACPDVAGGEAYYACPAAGCPIYRIQLNDPSYEPGASSCDPYPMYRQDPPEDDLHLLDIASGRIVRRDPERGRTAKFQHYQPQDWPEGCSIEENRAVTSAPGGKRGVGGRVPGS